MFGTLENRVRDAYDWQSAIPGDEAFWTAEMKEIAQTGTPTVFIRPVDHQGKAAESTRFVVHLGYLTADGAELVLIEDGSEVHGNSPITRPYPKVAQFIAENRYGKGVAFKLV